MLQNVFLIQRVLLPYANFISANFITAVFQNFPKIFALCDFMSYLFHYRDFYTWLMRLYVLSISLLRSICLMQFLANATFSRSQKSHKARTLCICNAEMAQSLSSLRKSEFLKLIILIFYGKN